MSNSVRYHHGDLARALLDAGDEVLQNHGLQGFTLRECARQAGVSHAAPKHHFGSVKGLLTALAARGFERLANGLERRMKAAGDDLNAQFIATSTAYTRFAKRYPEHFRIMFRDDLLEVGAPELRTAAGRTFLILTNVIRRQRGEPDMEPGTLDFTNYSPHLLEDILIGWCYVHGYAHLLLENQFDMMPAELADSLRTNVATRLSDLIQRPR